MSARVSRIDADLLRQVAQCDDRQTENYSDYGCNDTDLETTHREIERSVK